MIKTEEEHFESILEKLKLQHEAEKMRTAVLFHPNDILMSLDLYTIECINQHWDQFPPTVLETMIAFLMSIVNSTQCPLHKLIRRDNQLILQDMLEEKEGIQINASFVHSKPNSFLFKSVADMIIAYDDTLWLNTEHKSRNYFAQTILEDFNHFIIVEPNYYIDKIIERLYPIEIYTNRLIPKAELIHWMNSYLNERLYITWFCDTPNWVETWLQENQKNVPEENQEHLFIQMIILPFNTETYQHYLTCKHQKEYQGISTLVYNTYQELIKQTN